MKALKIGGGIVVLLIIVVAALAFTMPTHVNVTRTTTIDAPSDYVMDHVNNFAQINAWSPWMDKDPEMTSSLEGEDGTVGAKYSWSGNDEVGKGEQTLTEISEGKVVSHLHFITPYEGEADATTTFSEVDGMTEVSWAYDSEMPMPMNVMGLFMDMEDMLGPDFQQGMDNLKALVESNKSSKNEFDGFTIETVDMPERTYIGIRDTVAMTDIGAFFATNFGQIAGSMTAAGMEMVGMPSGLYFIWDETGKNTEMMAAIPVAAGAELEGFESFKISGKALKVDQYGPYEDGQAPHMAIEKYLKWHKSIVNGPAIEEYANDPTTVSDPSEIHTIIYYPIE